MNYRRLGNAGLKVSELSFGSWVSFGTQMNVDTAYECMVAAYDAGVNFFDNAEAYARGESEVIMGQIFKRAGWRRASYVVSTKFFWGLNDGPNERNTLNRKYLMQAIDGSLQRLDMEYVDLIFCHRADPNTPIEETVFAMDDIIRQGKALYWGTSEWSADEIRAAWEIAERHHLHKPQMEQPQYNLFHRLPGRRLRRPLPRAGREGICAPLHGHRSRSHHLESTCIGVTHGQVQRWHSSRQPRQSTWLRMAQICAERPNAHRQRPRPADRCRRFGLHNQPAGAGLVRQEPARQYGDYRCQPRLAGT